MGNKSGKFRVPKSDVEKKEEVLVDNIEIKVEDTTNEVVDSKKIPQESVNVEITEPILAPKKKSVLNWFKKVSIRKDKKIQASKENGVKETADGDVKEEQKSNGIHDIAEEPKESDATEKASDVTEKASDVTEKASDVTEKASDVTDKACDVTDKACDVIEKPIDNEDIETAIESQVIENKINEEPHASVAINVEDTIENADLGKVVDINTIIETSTPYNGDIISCESTDADVDKQ